MIIEEEKKRLLAEMLYALRVHKEIEEGRVQYAKPELSKKIPKKEKKVKTFKEKVMDVILFPYRLLLTLVFVFLIIPFSHFPILTLLIIFLLVRCGCD